MANQTDEAIEVIHPIDHAMWLELQTREIDNVNKRLDGERKNRAKREFVLIITCLLALLYTYPVQNFLNNPTIEIPSISLKIPVKDAIAVFPTLIAAIYLVFLASAIGESINLVRASRLEAELRNFKDHGSVEKIPAREIHFNLFRYLFLPSPLHTRAFTLGAGALPKAIVDLFVGSIFTLLPYATASFIVIRSWKLLHLKLVLFWNLLCLLIMTLAFTSALLGAKPRRRSQRW